jgi:membrane-associated phospholipid phosphatase
MLPCALGALLAWRLQRRDWVRLLVCVMIASSVAGVCAATLRGLTGRVRPRVTTVEPGWYGPRHQGKWVSTKWDYNSFPSGHVTVAAAFCAAFFLRRRSLGLALVWLPVSVAAARMYLGAHHLSDVVAGSAFGVLLAVWSSDLFWSRTQTGTAAGMQRTPETPVH